MDISEHRAVRAGSPLPLGTHPEGDGVNFALFSRHATRVRLEFFDHPNLPERIRGLGRLAYNLWWSWHPAARMLFMRAG